MGSASKGCRCRLAEQRQRLRTAHTPTWHEDRAADSAVVKAGHEACLRQLRHVLREIPAIGVLCHDGQVSRRQEHFLHASRMSDDAR